MVMDYFFCKQRFQIEDTAYTTIFNSLIYNYLSRVPLSIKGARSLHKPTQSVFPMRFQELSREFLKLSREFSISTANTDTGTASTETATANTNTGTANTKTRRANNSCTLRVSLKSKDTRINYRVYK